MMTQRNAIAAVLAITALTLTGCGGMISTAPVSVAGAGFHGKLMGGQQPISGSSIQLYAAGNTGYGSAFTYAQGTTSLLGNNIVNTDAGGYFAITGDYTCPSATTPIYIVAYGGNPGLAAGSNNSSIVQIAALGPCGQLTSSLFISISEVTTIASVYALSPFMTDITHIGSTSSNTQGLLNAFATVNKLANISKGTASGPALPSTATLPVAKINTLANILAACVNTGGGVAGDGSPCGLLFTYTTVNGVAPTTTAAAAMNIAQHPNLQTTALTQLPTTNAPFQPGLTVAPADFSIVITYNGGGIKAPSGLATDNSGNTWVANAGNNNVTQIDALGVTTADATGYLSGTTGYTAGSLNAPAAVAIDLSGNAWLANAGDSTVTRISASGMTGTVFTGGNLSSPSSLAIDANSNVWVANSGNGSLTEINSAGVLANYTSAGIAGPTAIAINPK
jgi:hypothetical protein